MSSSYTPLKSLLNYLLFALFIFTSDLSFAKTLEEKLAKEQAAATSFSVYVTMRDGVRIAVDIHLPTFYRKGDKLPVLLYQTIYQRSSRIPLVDKPNISQKNDWQNMPKLDHKASSPIEFQALKQGYVVIKTDVRGTGASFGHRNSPLPPAEIQDTYDLLDWIIAQPWSNGKVGAYGISYTGMTAGMAATVQHPALKAIVIGWSGIYDEYKNAMQPFGFVQPGVLCKWSDYLAALWSNNYKVTGKAIMPVDGDENAVLLQQAIKDHQQNETVCDLLSSVTFSDDKIGQQQLNIQSFSQRGFKKEIEASGVAILSLASWYDTGAVDAHFVRMLDFSNEQKIFITGAQHGARSHASPYTVSDKVLPPIPSGEVTWGKAITFFDYYLKGIKNDYPSWPKVTYWNLGEEAFHSSDVWPLKNSKNVRFYFDEQHSLTRIRPKYSSQSDRYQVDFSATTGKNSRWWSGMGYPMLNLNARQEEDKKLLIYTSAPLTEDMQITGWPIVSLTISSTHSDGAFIAYLEDVDEQGNSIYVNEGGLRAIHRKIKPNPVKGLAHIPYHSFERADAELLTPNMITEIKFEMIPTSVKIAKGHRIRIAIAGADKDNFVRIPAKGQPIIKLYRGGDKPSYVDFPVIY
ncbi:MULTISPECIES: CocE/NonD family hydrolase [Colwellia]|uniref:Acylase n=2 Tax=Colwellia TaxID=28228 RepID=A0ABQ0MS07_9GAMM|nr:MULTISPECIES: CocE/NonD family hydrolase [Colwellia]GAW95165.1 acylase [Colwellia marinimaniae]